MNRRDAVELIRGTIPDEGGTWADLGCGEGVFTGALADLLGPEGRIYAVDRDAVALAELARQATARAALIVPVVADFTQPFELPGQGESALDGLLLANSLHYVREQETVLDRLGSRLRAGGRLVLVEYDQRVASRWVPYPIPRSRLPEPIAAAGFSAPVVVAIRASEFGGELYAAYADRIEGPARGR